MRISGVKITTLSFVILLLSSIVSCGESDPQAESSPIASQSASTSTPATRPPPAAIDTTAATETAPPATTPPSTTAISGPPDSDWNWQLTGELNMTVDTNVWDIDLFETHSETIAELRQNGRYVICYFSAGSIEDWRPDVDGFDPKAIGLPLDGWEGENWLDVRAESSLTLANSRLRMAKQAGCDAVEPDNVDGFTNETGFPLTSFDQIKFNTALARTAHEYGLAIGLKNSLDIASELADEFDFSVTEQCHQYEECELLAPFLNSGKPVLNAEYPGSQNTAIESASATCPEAKQLGIHTLLLPLDLDGSWRVSCETYNAEN
ncbi:MAG: endo alpha-1,4 polygalactosaminidase [Chloroflexi bacterium]|nr:endo alpha-1,4 polygalactosaminidase [Chloroflexota bacterium]